MSKLNVISSIHSNCTEILVGIEDSDFWVIEKPFLRVKLATSEVGWSFLFRELARHYLDKIIKMVDVFVFDRAWYSVGWNIEYQFIEVVWVVTSLEENVSMVVTSKAGKIEVVGCRGNVGIGAEF